MAFCSTLIQYVKLELVSPTKVFMLKSKCYRQNVNVTVCKIAHWAILASDVDVTVCKIARWAILASDVDVTSVKLHAELS